jgi:hypothetical protein
VRAFEESCIWNTAKSRCVSEFSWKCVSAAADTSNHRVWTVRRNEPEGFGLALDVAGSAAVQSDKLGCIWLVPCSGHSNKWQPTECCWTHKQIENSAKRTSAETNDCYLRDRQKMQRNQSTSVVLVREVALSMAYPKRRSTH